MLAVVRCIKGGKISTFFQPMHWVFGFNAKNPMSVNKPMVLFQHWAPPLADIGSFVL